MFVSAQASVEFNIAECTDTDGGTDFYNQGVLRGYSVSHGAQELEDFCVDRSIGGSNGLIVSECTGGNCQVGERVCEPSLNNPGDYVTVYSQCADGCKNGACVGSGSSSGGSGSGSSGGSGSSSCTDSDGGNNIYERGSVSPVVSSPASFYPNSDIRVVSDTEVDIWVSDGSDSRFVRGELGGIYNKGIYDVRIDSISVSTGITEVSILDFHDYCIGFNSGDGVNERTCSPEGRMLQEGYECLNGCIDGACVRKIQITNDVESVQEPSILQRTNGDLVILFNAGYQDIERGIYSVTSFDGGKTWSNLSWVIDSWDDVDFIEDRNRDLVLLAIGNEGLHTWKYSSGSSDWVDQGKVTPTGINNAVGAIIHANDGKYYVSYTDDSGKRNYVTSSIDLVEWTSPILISSADEPEFDSSMIQLEDTGEFFMVLNSYAEDGIRYFTSNDGNLWNDFPYVLSANTHAHMGLNVIEFDKKPYVFYNVQQNLVFSVLLGTEWSYPQKVIQGDVTFGGDVVVLGDDFTGGAVSLTENLGVAYVTDDNGQRDLFFEVTNIPFSPVECVDSDGGKDYYTKGKIISGQWPDGRIVGPNDEIHDICARDNNAVFEGDKNALFEYFCDENGIIESTDRDQVYNCPNGCQDGACIGGNSCKTKSEYNINTMNRKIDNNIERLFVEDQRAVLYLPNRMAEVYYNDAFGIGFGIGNHLETQRFRWGVTVADDNIRKKCGVSEREAEAWITTGSSGSVDIAANEVYTNIVRFKIPEGAVSDTSSCIIRYKLTIKKEDGTPYSTEPFDVDVRGYDECNDDEDSKYVILDDFGVIETTNRFESGPNADVVDFIATLFNDFEDGEFTNYNLLGREGIFVAVAEFDQKITSWDFQNNFVLNLLESGLNLELDYDPGNVYDYSEDPQILFYSTEGDETLSVVWISNNKFIILYFEDFEIIDGRYNRDFNKFIQTYQDKFPSSLETPKKPVKDVKLYQGWNLVSPYPILPTPLSKIASRDFRKFFGKNDIRAVFLYNHRDREFLRFHPASQLIEITRFLQSLDLLDRNNNLKKNSEDFQTVLHSSVWMFSKKDQLLSVEQESSYELDLEKTKLNKGWNFLSVTPEMVGKSLDEWKGDCKVITSAIWSGDFQNWDIGNAGDFGIRFTENLLWKGLSVKVLEDCKLGDNIAPPTLPGGTSCTDSDGGINLVKQGDICVDGTCFDGDFCNDRGSLVEYYCDGNEAKSIERWGRCENGALDLQDNPYLIVGNIGEAYINNVDSQRDFCDKIREDQFEFPGLDISYDCDVNFASYAFENNPYGGISAMVFVKDDPFSLSEVEDLKDELVEGYTRLFNEFNEEVTFEVTKGNIGGNVIYDVELRDRNDYLPMIAWYSGNKIIFISSDDHPIATDEQFETVAEAYLDKYPSELV